MPNAARLTGAMALLAVFALLSACADRSGAPTASRDGADDQQQTPRVHQRAAQGHDQSVPSRTDGQSRIAASSRTGSRDAATDTPSSTLVVYASPSASSRGGSEVDRWVSVPDKLIVTADGSADVDEADDASPDDTMSDMGQSSLAELMLSQARAEREATINAIRAEIESGSARVYSPQPSTSRSRVAAPRRSTAPTPAPQRVVRPAEPAVMQSGSVNVAD